MKKIAFALAAVAALPTAADAQVVNGSFEQGAEPGTFITLGAGSTAITGWTVGGEGVDYIGTYFTASDGARSVDLSGNGPGSLTQILSTVTGQLYNVTFDLAGNGDGQPDTKTATVFATGGDTTTFSVAGSDRPDLDFTSFLYSFRATGASTSLTFASTTATAFGPVLDNVAIAAVPEPAAWALMIGGVGLVGGTLRRRRSVKFATA